MSQKPNLPFLAAFNDSRGEPILHMGVTVYRSFKCRVSQNTDLRIQAIEQVSRPPQSLHLHAKNCKIKIFDHAMEDGWLEAQYMRKPTQITFEDVGEDAVFMFWNSTWASNQLGQESIGNYGMLIEEQTDEPRTYLIRCNHHVPGKEPDFKSLVVRLTELEK